MIQFALFGAGVVGNVHGDNIAKHPRAKLHYVYDVNAEAARRAVEKFGGQAAASPDEIWEADEVDAVLIASSTHTHADLLSRAIKAKKAVYCEKPIDLDISKVKSVVQEAHQSGVPVFIGFRRRFISDYQTIYESVRNGEIGQIEMMHLISRDLAPPPMHYIKFSGGLLRDKAIHYFDLACWLAGEDPVEIYASGSCLVDPEIGKVGDIDTAMLILRMPSGALCHIDNSRRSIYGYDERVEVFGSRGMVQSQQRRIRDVARYTDAGIMLDSLRPEYGKISFKRALDAFITTVENNTPPSSSLMDGLRAQMIAEAAVQSLQTNQPVKVAYWQPT